MAYEKLLEKVHKIENENINYSDSFIRYSKEQHLNNIKKSGFFRYVREIVFANTEQCNTERYYGIAVSQGGLQAILKQEPELIKKELKEFYDVITEEFRSAVRNIEFCYRMRLGVK